MKNLHDIRPPRLPMAFFRWFCHPGYREEIEGDLLEQFHLNADRLGTDRANWLFAADVLRLFRPEIMVNFHLFTAKFLEMKKENWLKLTGLNLLFALFVLLPFMPGPSNKISIGLSALGQFSGFFGLLLIPIGVVWAIVEWKKRSAKTTPSANNWNNGYYFALAATVIGVLIYSFVMLAFCFLEKEGWWVIAVSAPPLLLVLWKILLGIQNLRKKIIPRFNPAPFYLLSIPVVALLAKLLLMTPVAQLSREIAIRQSRPLIAAIENFQEKEGRYPEALAELHPAYLRDIPKPGIMGISSFRYEKTPEAYQLFFWQHLGATEELVMYHHKNDRRQMKGHYASYDAKTANWRYYWLD